MCGQQKEEKESTDTGTKLSDGDAALLIGVRLIKFYNGALNVRIVCASSRVASEIKLQVWK